MKNYHITKVTIILLLFIGTLGFAQNNLHKNNFTDGKTCLIVQHNIADYNTWYKAYKKDKTRREKAGIFEKLVMTDEMSKNQITVVFELKNISKANKFFKDPHSAELMQNAGVISEPNFTYFNVENLSHGEGNAFLIVQHSVKDYKFWKEKFDDHQSVRSNYGISVTAVGNDMSNPLKVIAIFNSDSSENFKTFLEKSDLKEAMQLAGITSEPNIEFMASSN